MIADSLEKINGENEVISPPPKDDYICLTDIGMTERDFKLRYPHVVMYGPADDPYVSLAELEEGDYA